MKKKRWSIPLSVFAWKSNSTLSSKRREIKMDNFYLFYGIQKYLL